MRHYSELSPLEKKAREERGRTYCVDYPICMLSGRCADDEPCDDYKEDTDHAEPGND